MRVGEDRISFFVLNPEIVNDSAKTQHETRYTPWQYISKDWIGKLHTFEISVICYYIVTKQFSDKNAFAARQGCKLAHYLL